MSNLTAGSVLAGYRIEGVVARGGMGVVYRATQLALERPVALKVIAPEVADDPTFRERFQRESRLAASIDHPNVIPVHEAGEAGGVLYITMRLVDGIDLGRLIARDGPLPPERTAHIVAQIAAALDAAHSRGLIHRDVKPANILVAVDDHVYLTDFGLVKAVDHQSGPTQTGQVVGTVNYVSPEQIHGEGADARSDVYALGCVVFQALTGGLPFARETPVATMWAHSNDEPPSLGGDLASLDGVLARALAKDPAERYPSAGDLARAFSAAVSGQRIAAPERSVARGDAAPDGATEPLTPPTPRAGLIDDTPTRERRQPGREGRRVLILCGLVLAAIAVVVVAVTLASGGGDSAGTHDALKAKSLSVTTVDVPGDLQGIAVGEGAVWVTDHDKSTVVELNDRTGEREGDPIAVGSSPTAIAVGGGYVWALTDDGVSRIDPDSHQTTGQPVKLRNGISPADIEYGDGSVWTIDSSSVTQIDPVKLRIRRTIDVGPNGGAIAVGDGVVWVPGPSYSAALKRIGTATGRVATGGTPVAGSVASGFGSGWAYDQPTAGTRVVRLDPRTGRQTAVTKFDGGSGVIATGGGAVWTLDTSNHLLTRIDPKTARITGAQTGVSADSESKLAVGTDAAWVTLSSGKVTRIGF